MRDNSGNEYLYVDFTSTVYGRQPLLITDDHTAGVFGTSGRGRVGVAVTTGTSNQSGWVQIYGRCVMQIGMGTTGPSPSDDANGPTTLSTSLRTRFIIATSETSPAALGWTSDASTDGYFVEGITVASDASPSNDVSDTCTTTSHTGAEVGVFLNYPQVMYRENVSST